MKKSFQTNLDIREIPSYSIPEAAHYLRIPVQTLRSWIRGRRYPVKGGQRYFKPLVATPDHSPLLSFINLVEAHVLSAIRKDHQIPLESVRKALEYLGREYPSKHPLADYLFETDGIDLFLRKYGHLENISKDGQLAMAEVLHAYLRRIERDPSGLPIKLYPFTRKRQPEEPKTVVIDPTLAFGRPVLAGTGIATHVIAERYKAGESIKELAEDYGLSPSQIEEAIRCELPLEAA
ncbi:MAG: DUF433 domain-containing protein [Candidatus Manganitrophus sp. SA1]|nr:DUF433 domain-containing protein [Candidatus Manganitrophus morganii]